MTEPTQPSSSQDIAPGSGESRAGSVLEVFGAFLRLGLTSFGGPIAHLGYFREQLVQRRRWISEAGYGDYLALCQFLPGPASSQLAFVLGLHRSGKLAGGLAAWFAFTLPSALVMLACGLGAARLDGPVAAGLVHGLKLVAVAVVAQALWGMAQTLTPDRTRAGIALAAVGIALLWGGPFAQISAILLGLAAGYLLCRGETGNGQAAEGLALAKRRGFFSLIIFAALFFLPALLGLGTGSSGVGLFDVFYRAGALVFGGGHVLLPLLQGEVVARGWVDGDQFLAGYGLAQAIPGPLFTFAAYLGAIMGREPTGLTGGLIAMTAVSLPGLLLVYGVLPFWRNLQHSAQVKAAMMGANAAVVGILGAAFYNPIWTSAVLHPRDFAMALAGFLGLVFWRAPSWMVVTLLAAANVLMSL